MSRAGFALALAGALLLGGAIDRIAFVQPRKDAAAPMPVDKPSARANGPELAACVSARNALRVDLTNCNANRGDAPPECAPCPVCPSVPAMPGMTPEEEAAAERGESPGLKPLLAACEKRANTLGNKLSRCVRGLPLELDPGTVVTDPRTPPMTREEEQASLLHAYDSAIMVKRVDGSVRIYRPGEWPPAGGVGEGNRVIAQVRDGGAWGPPDKERDGGAWGPPDQTDAP
jgi:hypothetical protein